MPQIGQLTQDNWYLISQIFWLVLVFGAIFLVVGRGMLPKIEATVDARDAKIAGDLAAAKAARDEADRIEEDWRDRTNAARAEAQAAVAAAKASAAKDAEKRLAKADADIAAKLAAAEADIGTAQRSAMAEIDGVAAEIAGTLVQQLTRRSVAPAQLAQAVKAQIHG